jgi:hypothetical protein
MKALFYEVVLTQGKMTLFVGASEITATEDDIQMNTPFIRVMKGSSGELGR